MAQAAADQKGSSSELLESKLTDISKCWDEVVTSRKTVAQDLSCTALESLKGGQKSWMEIFAESLPDFTIKLPDFLNCSFKEMCEIIIARIKDINELLGPETFEEVEYQLEQREVLISIYGDSNVGKSTVINSIMGNWYLPSNKKTETAISVYIHFNNPWNDSASNGNDKDSPTDFLCNHKMENIADGPEEIKKKLEELNRMTRAEQHFQDAKGATISSQKYHLFLRKPLIRDTCGRDYEFKLILLDNPGYDEYDCGTGAMEKVVEQIQLISSAYVFVITFDTYTKTEVSKQLKSLYTKNTDIFRQKRLTIVINKIDEAVKERLNEPEYTEDQVVSEIRDHLCSKIFQCQEDELPMDAIIPISGLNALLARAYKTKSSDKKIERQVRESLSASSLGLVHPEEDMACVLEERSHIGKLEDRLQNLARKASQLWKLKMCTDLISHMERMNKMLTRQIELKEQHISRLISKLQQMYGALQKLNVAYKDIVSQYQKCNKKGLLLKGSAIWNEFRNGCNKDMKKDVNIEMQLIKSTSAMLELFKVSTSTKINEGGYTPYLFEKDLISFFREISEELSKKMSSWDSFYNMSAACAKANLSVENTVEDLKGVIGIAQSDKGTSYFPHLSGPSFKIKLEIPFSERTFLGNVLHWMKCFIWTLPELEKSYSVDLDLKTSTTLDHRKVIQDVPPVSSSGDSSSSQPSCDIPSHKSNARTPEKPETSTTRGVIYRKWSTELEEMKDKIKNGITDTINTFFKDLDNNIIQTCCKQHFDAALQILKHFDASAEGYFAEFKQRFEIIVKEFKQINKELKFYHEDLKCVNYMLCEIRREYDMCSKETANS